MGVGKWGREGCGCEDKAVLEKGDQGGAQDCKCSLRPCHGPCVFCIQTDFQFP